MNAIQIIALSEIAITILIICLSPPLILRKIPMNHLYGVRFSASFKSEKNWYEFNEYGGKALLIASIPIFIYGIVGLLFHQQLPEWYIWIGSAVVLASLLAATWVSYQKAIEIDRKNG